jgi:hypothetical protein
VLLKGAHTHIPNPSHADAHRFSASNPGAKIHQLEARGNVRTGPTPMIILGNIMHTTKATIALPK